MLRYIYGDDLPNHPKLMDTMFTDRARQFGARLSWDISIDENGHERDVYDELNPLYVIWEADGRHGGSMRFLPTTASTPWFLQRPIHNMCARSSPVLRPASMCSWKSR